MSAEVVDLDIVTKLDLPPTRILEKANAQPFDQVVVVGLTDEGDFWFSSSAADGGTVLWLLELAKKKLLEVGEVEEA